MSRTAEDWGRVAVSLPGWKWMMSMSDISGLIALEWVDKKRTKLRCWDIHDPSCHGEYTAYYLTPDPDDPATAGCLLALLGSRCLVRILPREGRALSEIVIPGGLTLDGRPHRINGHDLGRACIAAAEALGRWPGGDS